ARTAMRLDRSARAASSASSVTMRMTSAAAMCTVCGTWTRRPDVRHQRPFRSRVLRHARQHAAEIVQRLAQAKAARADPELADGRFVHPVALLHDRDGAPNRAGIFKVS